MFVLSYVTIFAGDLPTDRECKVGQAVHDCRHVVCNAAVSYDTLSCWQGCTHLGQ